MNNLAGIDLLGKIVKLKQAAMSASLKPEDHLFRCEGGFGCNPASMGTKVFGTFLSDGEQCFIRRGEIDCVVTDEAEIERVKALRARAD